MRNRWSVRVSVLDMSGNTIILFRDDFANVHTAAEALGMKYTQLSNIVKNGGVYGGLRTKNRFSPIFEVVKIGKLPILDDDIRKSDM